MCFGFALHAANLAGQTRLRRYVHLVLVGLFQGAYCITAWRYLSLTDAASARPWGHGLCTFTPFITYFFGELAMELIERHPPWLVRFQRTNLTLTTGFVLCTLVDILGGTTLVLESEIETNLATLHRHLILFTPLGFAYLGWVTLAFTAFTVVLIRAYLARRDLLPLVLGSIAYFIATVLDFTVVARFRDGLFVQHFGCLGLVVGSWRVISSRFEAALDEVHLGIQRLEEQRNRLLAAPQQHKQSLASLGAVAAGVAHEINNPVHGIMNYAHLLKQEVEPDTAAREFVEEIAHEAQHVADIARSLLRFGRTDDALAVATSIGDIVEHTLSLMRSSLVQDGITLRLQVDPDLPETICRATQLEQAIMNLIANARDAVRARSPERTDARVITIEATQRVRDGDLWIVVKVTDTGDGFDPALAERIFDPFFTTRGPESTGLGLSVSLGIIQSHGGQLTCESVRGKGASFRFEIPCTPKV